MKPKLLALDPFAVVLGDNIRTLEMKNDIEQMAEDLLAVGFQLQPVGVRREGRDLWRVVYGHRRAKAIQLLNRQGRAPEPLHKLLAVEVPSGAAEDDVVFQVQENSARRNLRPQEEAEIIDRLCRSGRSVQDIARIFGRTPGWVSQRHALLRLPEDIRRLVGVKIGVYDGYLLACMDKLERQRRLKQLLRPLEQQQKPKPRRKRRSIDSAVRLLRSLRVEDPQKASLIDAIARYLAGSLKEQELENLIGS